MFCWIRNDIETVIDRLAWENIQSTRPLCSNLADEIKRLKASHTEVERQVAELRWQIDRIYKSHSWRVTEPLRKIRRMVGGDLT